MSEYKKTYLYGYGSRINSLASGVFPIINAKESTDDLDVVFANQGNVTVAFISGQSEANQATNPGTVHMVISFRRAATYGKQIEFVGNAIWVRTINGGSWSAWAKVSAV